MAEILQFTWHNIRRLLTSPRLYLSLFVVYACLRLCFGNVYLYLEESGETLQAVELMVFASSNRSPQWMLTFGMLLLLGDAPFLHAGISVYLVRSSRRRWFMGQILFCFITVVCYLLTIEIMLLSMSGNGVSFLNNWSDPIVLASRITAGASLLHIEMAIDFPMSIISSGKPYAMFALTMLYDTLLLTMLSLLCLACNVKWKTGVGCFGVVVLLVVRFLIERCGVLTDFWILSPCNLATISNQTVNPAMIGYTTAFFLCACGLLGIWGYHTMRFADLQRGEGL